MDALKEADDTGVLGFDLFDHFKVGIADKTSVFIIVTSSFNEVHSALSLVDACRNGSFLHHFGHVAFQRIDWKLSLFCDLSEAQSQIGRTQVTNLLLDQALKHQLSHT